MKTSDFDYELPMSLIAQAPTAKRDDSRLLVLDKSSGEISHCLFPHILDELQPGDVLVLNTTRVIPARLYGRIGVNQSPVEVVLLNKIDMLSDEWEVLVRPGRKFKIDAEIVFGKGELKAKVVSMTNAGRRLKFFYQGDFNRIIAELGTMPLPPYIHEKLSDPQRYQTIYANVDGSAAAPTAGLHFTSQLLKEIEKKGIEIVPIVLHVGLGTFLPVKAENIEKHVMHKESYFISQQSAARINLAKESGSRVIAVGTTSVRCLESSIVNGEVSPGSGDTDIFIFPGYEFRIVDALITNFHLPRSTLLMLVSAFAGKENILKAYRNAVKEQYRFFSFGDAMFIK